MRENENKVTEQLMQLCYTCADAANCTTEAACLECWTALAIACDQVEEVDETQELLRLYAQ